MPLSFPDLRLLGVLGLGEVVASPLAAPSCSSTCFLSLSICCWTARTEHSAGSLAKVFFAPTVTERTGSHVFRQLLVVQLQLVVFELTQNTKEELSEIVSDR